MREKLGRVCKAFCIEGELLDYEELRAGNVNRTYRVDILRPDGGRKSYIAQAVNTYVFKNPVQVMENIDRVTEHIRSKKPGGVALHFYHTRDRRTYWFDEDGFWRLFNFIPSETHTVCDDLVLVENAGGAFGEFQMLLSDFDAADLYETIPQFHNTRRRYEKLAADAAADPCGRAEGAQAELDWLLSVEDAACALTDLYEAGQLPLRVTHNDTKINNVLFAPGERRAIAVIDLDTVMPGLVGHDFGDAIRSAANFVEEDSPEAERAGVNLAVFRAFSEGFLKKTAAALTEREIDLLAGSCFSLAAELAARFLDDYLLGDPYFKTDYPEHNLVRARCQIALAKDMRLHMAEMEEIVHACAAKYRRA